VGTIAEWWSQGELARIALRQAERTIFMRRAGTGPSLTLLHGFPSSSHDWAQLLPALAARHELLALDFLGFGASAKPPEHKYTIAEQADLVEAAWALAGIQTTLLVVHDYAVTVAQELLARRASGSLAVDLQTVLFLNGGLYADVYRPLPGQEALLDPQLGPQISAALNREAFVEALRPTFAESFDSLAAREQIWEAMSRDDGQLSTHRLIRYMLERKQNATRWQDALEQTDVPVTFVWGMLDPISGAHMAKHIRERLPDAPFTALDDVSHWPMLEAPDQVAAAILAEPR
jgi:pimeloyl-ACP methyl ester carboxylesterase